MASHQTSLAKASNAELLALRKKGGRALTLAIAAPLVSGALLVLYAYFLARTLGAAIEDGVPITSLFPLLWALVAIVIVRALIGLVGEQAGQIGAERIKAALRLELFDRLLRQRSALGLKPASGAISAALVDQVEGIENFFARYLPAMIAAGALPIAFAVVVFPVDWIIGLLFILTAPAIPLFMALAGWGAQAATDRQAIALTRLSAHFADRLRGLVTLKLFGREKQATEDVHAASESLRKRTNAVLRIAFLSSAILEFFAALGVAGVALYVGLTFLGFLPFHPELTLVAGFFTLIMAPEVYNPLRQLAAHYHDRAAARSALDEIERQVARLDRETAASFGLAATPSADGLRIAGLTVLTPEGRPVLEGLNLDLAPGTSLAIMGPSGIGKSTLARALARLVPSEGDIALGSIPLASWPEHDLRRHLAYIAQKPRIFVGTIFENIAFANPEASPDHVRMAAELALVSDFASALPQGLSTLVGEGGLGLSGGQIQRIGLARLFLTDPGLIVLDEPTAHLDDETQDKVLDAIFSFAQDRTLIVLTHAQDVADRADRVMRMAGGKLFAMPHRVKGTRQSEDRRA